MLFEFVLVVARPTPVQAFPGEALAASIWKEIRDQLREIRTTIREKAWRAIKISADVAFKNSLRVFTGKLAEDTATWIASAGTGQKPLFVSDKRYWNNLVDAAAGDFIDTYARRFFGASLCAPPPEKISLILSIASSLKLKDQGAARCEQQCTVEAADRFEEIARIQASLNRVSVTVTADQLPDSPGPTNVVCPVRASPSSAGQFDYDPNGQIQYPSQECFGILTNILTSAQASSNQTLKNCQQQCRAGARTAACTFTTVRENLAQLDTATISREAGAYFDPGNNDLGQLLRVYEAASEEQALARAQEEAALRFGFQPRTNITGDQILAPAESVAQRFNVALDNATKADTTYTGSIAADTIRIFTNTLISRLTERVFKGKCGLNPAACNASNTQFSLTPLTNLAAAQLQFSRLGQVDYVAGDATRTTDVFQVMRSRGLQVDERLIQAVNEKRTVKEALDAGLLDGGKTFGFDVQGNEPQDGYPYRLLVYLRHYRIIPVAWEIAALHIKNFDRQDIGLSQLVQLFDQKKTDIDPNSPTANRDIPSSSYYGLIDPNWVLKAPSTFCRRQGAGEETISRQFTCDEDNELKTGGVPDGKVNCGTGNDIGKWVVSRNNEYCTDEQSCIAENDDGTCRQYGYCFAEKNIWRFGGTSCPNYVASCVAFTSQAGQESALLTTTTNGLGCSADNAGCRWYCDDPAGPNTEGNWSCTVGSSINKIYIDRDAEQCNASAAGCSEFLRTTNGTNLLRNASFEVFSGTLNDSQPDTFSNWTLNGNSPEAVGSDNSTVVETNTTAAVLFSAGGAHPLGTQLRSIHPSQASLVGRPFTVSGYTRTFGGTCQLPVALSIGGRVTPADPAQTVTVSSSWQRFEITGVPPATGGNPVVEMILGPPQGAGDCPVIVDNIQLEEGRAATAYKDYGAANQVYLSSQRQSCSPTEIGCEQYRPSNGDTPINGVATDANRCAADEVGCKAFREMEITTVPQRPFTDPVYIIPSTGQQCTAAAVGCEEYTNLDEQARGGEAQRYYTQIKQCVRPDSTATDQITYFSWVGSESRGFELRSYRLLKSDIATAPCTNLTVGSTSQAPRCDDAGNPVASCDAADLGLNPDCTEFFDSDGDISYRLRSRTINVTDRCFPARNSIDQGDPATANRIYMISEDESLTCGAAEANCREYKGNTGNNVRTIYSATFENGSTADWSNGAVLSTESVTVSGHSLRIPNNSTALSSSQIQPKVATGKSYTLTFWAKGEGAGLGLGPIAFSNGNLGEGLFFQRAAPSLSLSTEWNRYQLGPVFFSRAVGATEELVWYVTGGGIVYLDSIELKEVAQSAYLIKGSALTCDSAAANCEAYADRRNQRHYLTGFTSLCGDDKVGCEEVIVTQNSSSPESTTVRGITTPADGFARYVINSQAFCAASDKGCSLLGQPTIDENEVVSGWQTVPLKKNPDVYERILCSASEDRCEEFTSNLDGAKYYFRDPGARTCSYQRPARLLLCPDGRTPCDAGEDQVDADSCGAGVRCRTQNNTEFRWMITGTDTLCTSDKLLDTCEPRVSATGQPEFCYRSSPNNQCLTCVPRTCAPTQSGCTDYRDPSDPPNCRANCPLEIFQGKPQPVDSNCRPILATDGGVPGCKSYTYLRQSVEGTAAECGSQVNLVEGCRPFFDTSNPSRNFRGN